MRLVDAAAVLVVLAAVVKLWVAPRLLAASPQRLPPLVLPMLDGSTYRLAERRGRVVFLDFSTSWCEACKASLPLAERYARMHPDVDVVTVDSGETPAAAAAFARDRALNSRFLALDTDERVADAFEVEGYPTVVVIDPRGRMNARWFGYNPALESAMENARVTLTPR